MQPDIRPTLQQMVDALALILSGTARSSDGRMGRFDTPSWATLEQADDALAAGRALLSDAAPQEPQELKRLAQVALDESPPAVTDWHEAALRVCRAVVDAAPAAQPATPDAGTLSDEDLEEMALSAFESAMSFGVNVQAFKRLARSVLSRVQAVRKPLKTEEVHLTARCGCDGIASAWGVVRPSGFHYEGCAFRDRQCDSSGTVDCQSTAPSHRCAACPHKGADAEVRDAIGEAVARAVHALNGRSQSGAKKQDHPESDVEGKPC